MVTIPRLTYSDSEISEARENCPAIDRYLRLLEQKDAAVDDVFGTLRLKRHSFWIEAALATHYRRQSAQEICRQWSHAADEFLRFAWTESGLSKYEAALFALGKLGAEELNLSSDVDVVVVASAKDLSAVTSLIRRFNQLLSQNTDQGFVLRVDFDLRPGGRFGPIVTTPKQMSDYYWSQGETWERLAWIRKRAIVGDPAVIDSTNEVLNTYCFRKFLDYTLLDDLKVLRTRVHASYESDPHQLNLKLCIGGIRDIELFVHSMQVIHGGKRTDLRSPSTNEAIVKLNSENLLPSKESEFLRESYWKLRQLENQIQIFADRQTHTLDLTQGYPSLNSDEHKDLSEMLKGVDQVVSSLLGAVDDSKPQLPLNIELQTRWLKSLQFNDESLKSVWPQLLGATALSRHSERDELARRQFLFQFVTELTHSAVDRDLGLSLLLDFVKATRVKASFFTLLLKEPRLIRDLARLFSVSPYLGHILGSRPELLDTFVLRVQESFSTEWDQLLDQLSERRLLSEVVSATQFLDNRSVDALGKQLTDTADEIAKTLIDRLKSEFSPSTIEILALGKWGGSEMGLRSDLDFVMITKGPPTPSDQKIARRLISRLTESHRGGKIYAVDLRLRPSGAAGPLLVEDTFLENFIVNEAAPWQRQSYLRGRLLSGENWSAKKSVSNVGLKSEDLKELLHIRQRLILPADRTEQVIDIKLCSGGLAEMEFAVQIALLKNCLCPLGPSTMEMVDTLKSHDARWRQKSADFIRIYRFLRMVEQLYQLTSNHAGSQLDVNTSNFLRTSSLLKCSPMDLKHQLQSTLIESIEVLKDLDPLASPE